MAEIPQWLKSEMSATDLDKIRQAVARAETQTAAEIVPMIVRSSSVVHHVPMIFSLSLLILTFAIGWPEYVHFHFPYPWLALALTMAFILVIVIVFSRLPGIQRFFTSRADMAAQAHVRAELEFYRSNICQTHDSTGVLLFVSMLERQVVVLADKAIADKMPAETWQEVTDLCIRGIKEHSVAKGLCDAIERVGDILRAHVPARAHDKNELPNDLIIKE